MDIPIDTLIYDGRMRNSLKGVKDGSLLKTMCLKLEEEVQFNKFLRKIPLFLQKSIVLPRVTIIGVNVEIGIKPLSTGKDGLHCPHIAIQSSLITGIVDDENIGTDIRRIPTINALNRVMEENFVGAPLLTGYIVIKCDMDYLVKTLVNILLLKESRTNKELLGKELKEHVENEMKRMKWEEDGNLYWMALIFPYI